MGHSFVKLPRTQPGEHSLEKLHPDAAAFCGRVQHWLRRRFLHIAPLASRSTRSFSLAIFNSIGIFVSLTLNFRSRVRTFCSHRCPTSSSFVGVFNMGLEKLKSITPPKRGCQVRIL